MRFSCGKVKVIAEITFVPLTAGKTLDKAHILKYILYTCTYI
jgi:hypothetical protein